MRECVAFANEIQSSRVDHYKFLASLQGHKLETNFDDESSTSLSVEQQTKVDRYLEKLNEKIRGERGQK
jgi:predicted 3-demethylubiquinone-9 3-methyltransferase (glyoxalase superfamily)